MPSPAGPLRGFATGASLVVFGAVKAALVIALSGALLVRPAAAAPVRHPLAPAVRTSTEPAAPAIAQPIDLLTMGPGDRLFEVFGHAAICVGDPIHGSCFNYGVTDFQQSGMAIGFLRGKMPFYVEEIPYPRLLHYYRARDRDVWRQRLDLDLAGRQRIIARLVHDAAPENSRYPYDHFRANCTSKVRDVIDEAAGGALRKQTEGEPSDETFRLRVRRGFGGRPPLQWLADAIIGRTLDHLPSRWEAMFLPHLLRAEVAALKVGGRPVAPFPAERIQLRKAPNDPIAGSPSAGHVFGLAVALGLGLLCALGRRRGGWLERVALGFSGVFLTFMGVAAWFVALVSTSQDLRQNEALSVLWPTDLLLVVAAAVGPARLGRLLRGYLVVRTVGSLTALIAIDVGILHQPFEAWALLVVCTCGVFALVPPRSLPLRA